VSILRSRVVVAGVFAVLALISLPLDANQVSQGQAGAAPQGAKPPCRSPRISSIPQVQTIQRVSSRSFDGKTLEGWDGDPTFWRVENGAIVGESTPEKGGQPEYLPDLARRSPKGLRVERWSSR
jgi:hypothetical protein